MNTKYKQRKRHYKNSGVVILAELKVCAASARRPVPSPTAKGDPTPEVPQCQRDSQEPGPQCLVVPSIWES